MIGVNSLAFCGGPPAAPNLRWASTPAKWIVYILIFERRSFCEHVIGNWAWSSGHSKSVQNAPVRGAPICAKLGPVATRAPPFDRGKREAILATVRAIPRGRVSSYGVVASVAGLPGRARLVGRVLAQLPPDSDVPWQRVVNARGAISLPAAAGRRQRALLEDEGVGFLASGRVDLRRHAWP